jgi:flagellar hook-associated protein 1 FlgK
MLPSLYIGGSAMAAASRRVATASNNIANVNTEGYTRQRVELRQSASTPIARGVIGTGVTTVAVSRLRDALNGAAVRSESAVAGAATARASALSGVEIALGTYGDGAPEALSSFMDAWDALSLSPTDAGARQTVLDTGSELADSIRSASEQLAQTSSSLRGLLDQDVDTVNKALADLANLDKSVLDARTRGVEPNDLLDQRDQALDKLASLVGARASENEDGTIKVTVGDKTLLDHTQAKQLTTTTPPAAPAVQLEGQPISTGGAVGGVLGVLTGDLPALQAQLDEAAVSLRDAVNTVHTGSTQPDGTAGTAFFTGTGAADLRVAAGLTADDVATSRTGTRNDGSGALAMTTLRTKQVSGLHTVGDLLTAVGVKAGTAAASAARTAATATSSLESARAAQSATDGVNQDEEMIDLLSAQHAFEAAAKVVSITDEMMQTIIGMVR